MTDPITRAKRAAHDIEAARAAMSVARRERRAAVNEARATMTNAAIAHELGITPQRVGKIAGGKD